MARPKLIDQIMAGFGAAISREAEEHIVWLPAPVNKYTQHDVAALRAHLRMTKTPRPNSSLRGYTAHVITYVRIKTQPRETLPVYENLVMIAVTSAQEAVQKAADKARLEYVGDSEGTLTSDDEPAEMAFAGVRKVVVVDDPDERPGDGTELSYTELRVASIEVIERLAPGRPCRSGSMR